MQYRLTFAAMAVAMPLVNAYGVTVTNKCSAPAYVWSVGDTPSQMITLDSGSPSWSQDFFSKSGGGGPSIKIKDNDNLWDGGSESQLEYKWDGSTLWFDLSYINGIAFEGKDISMTTSNPSCPSVTCSSSDPTCSGGAYLHPNDIRTLSCPGGANLEMILCAGGSSPPPAPSVPASSSTPSPTPTKAVLPASTVSTTPASSASAESAGGDFLENNNKPAPMATAYATEIVAVTVTKHVPAATPFVDPNGDVHEKREAHLHQHKARGHSRVFGRHLH